MKKVIFAALFAFILSASQTLAATVEELDVVKTVGDLGTHTSSINLAYFGVLEGFKVPTKYNVVYVDISTEGGKAAYQLLLNAKTHGLKIKRLIYDNDETVPDSISKLKLIATW